jgi:hypothetical protein
MSLTTDPLGGKSGATSRALALGVRSASLVAHYDEVTGTNSYTATKACIVIIRAWGAGGSGGTSSTNNAGGGGGAAVGYRVIFLTAGQTISWSIGAGTASNTADPSNGVDGGDTTVTLPGGYVLTAGGGKKGTAAGVGGTGGVPSGPWDIGRNGGDGGGSNTAGGSPTGGGAGGSASTNRGGGGGGAGFSDLFPNIASGNGSNGNTSTAGGAPGGGSGGTPGGGLASGVGGNGRVIITVIAI